MRVTCACQQCQAGSATTHISWACGVCGCRGAHASNAARQSTQVWAKRARQHAAPGMHVVGARQQATCRRTGRGEAQPGTVAGMGCWQPAGVRGQHQPSSVESMSTKHQPPEQSMQAQRSAAQRSAAQRAAAAAHPMFASSGVSVPLARTPHRPPLESQLMSLHPQVRVKMHARDERCSGAEGVCRQQKCGSRCA